MIKRYALLYIICFILYAIISIPINYVIGNQIQLIPCEFPYGISIGFPPAVYCILEKNGDFLGATTLWLLPNIFIVYLISLFVYKLFIGNVNDVLPFNVMRGGLFNQNTGDTNKIIAMVKVGIFIVLLFSSMLSIINFTRIKLGAF